jgi:hypothetical protein
MTRALGQPTATVLLAVDDLQPGIAVVEDVFDPQGRLLMSAGTELTERHLRACQLWGITRIRVRAEGVPAEAAGPTPEQMAQAELETRSRFRNTDPTHPLLVELFRLCVIRAADRATGRGTPAHG